MTSHKKRYIHYTALTAFFQKYFFSIYIQGISEALLRSTSRYYETDTVWELKVFKTLAMTAITYNHFIASTSEIVIKKRVKSRQ